MEYQNFRSGAARGAEGSLEDIAKGLSLNALKLLPVVQLAEVLRRDKQPVKPEETPESPHVHFGAGRLALGLVIKAMEKGNVKDVVVVQRESADFSSILSSPFVSSFPIIVNGETVSTFRVYVQPEEIKELIHKLKERQQLLLQHKKQQQQEMKPERHFVITSDTSLCLSLLSIARSASCALGPGLRAYMSPLVNKLPDTPPSRQIYLYGCENDHATLEQLQFEFKNKIKLLPCMVDRICAERVIYKDRIEVSAEPYEGEIVVLDRPEDAPPPPFGGENIHAPKLKASANYLCQRKICLVNGLHAALAFLSATERTEEIKNEIKKIIKKEGRSRNQQGEPSPDPLLKTLKVVKLIKPKEMNKNQKETIFAWMVARCLLVLWEHDKEVIRRTHNLKTDDEVVEMLLSYGRNTLERFSTVDDTAGRVLAGGVVNRFHTRVLNIYKFLEQHIFGSVPLASNLLRCANLSAFEMIDGVRRLVEKSLLLIEKQPNK